MPLHQISAPSPLKELPSLPSSKAFTLSSMPKSSPTPSSSPVFLSSVEEGYLRLLCESLEEDKIIPLLAATPQIINSNPKTLALDFFYNYILKTNQEPLEQNDRDKIKLIFNSLLAFYQKTDLKPARFFSIQSPMAVPHSLPALSTPPASLALSSFNILEKCFINIENDSNFDFCLELLTPFMQINNDFLNKLYFDYLKLGAQASSIEDSPNSYNNLRLNKILKALERVKAHTSITDFLDQPLLAHIFLINGNLLKKEPSYEEAPLLSLLPKLITLHGFGRKIEEKVSKSSNYGTCLLALCIVRSKSEEVLNFLLPYVHYNYQKTKSDIAEYYRNHYGHQWTPSANFFNSMNEGDCQAIVDKYFLSHYTPPAKAGRTIKI